MQKCLLLLSLDVLLTIETADVDVKVYLFLAAITKFPKLRTLRLFPPYTVMVVTRGGETEILSQLRQPISDDQAIKIFHYLHSIRPSLQVLGISANREIAAWPRDFRAMSWEVRSQGDKTLLTTRQARKDYEVRQVWDGEKKLRTEIKRHLHPKPYVPHSEGWLFKDTERPM